MLATKYAVNEEGIAAMKATANAILESVEQVQGYTSTVRSAADEHQDSIGPHKAPLDEALSDIVESVKQAANPVNCISEMLDEVADAYEEIIGNDSIKAASENGETAGFAAAGSAMSAAASGDVLGAMINKYGEGNGSGSNKIDNKSEAPASYGSSLYGDKAFVPLLYTQQSTIHTDMDGKPVTIFDHPFEDTPGRICKQGSAYPDGAQGTCGCCACGTIINKAGGDSNEYGVVAYAIDNELCSKSGGTSPDSWVGILGAAGIASTITSGTPLNELADAVEMGKGVIIGVSACTYCRESYGRYFPGKADGHALVIESVVRDGNTGKIIEYIVSDSNGISSRDACRRVPSKILERAFRRRRGQSIVTDEIIW